MAVGGTNYSSQQPAQYMPSMQNIALTTRIWGTNGNTDTVTDASVHPGSCVVVTPVGTTPAGTWKVVVSQGSFVVTSSDPETATTMTYNYRIL